METPPKEVPPQLIKHKHSFTDWQWLIALFVFIGLAGIMSWLYYSTKSEKDEYQIKYNFVRSEFPAHTHLVDSFYQINPQLMQEYTQKSNENMYGGKNMRAGKSMKGIKK